MIFRKYRIRAGRSIRWPCPRPVRNTARCARCRRSHAPAFSIPCAAPDDLWMIIGITQRPSKAMSALSMAGKNRGQTVGALETFEHPSVRPLSRPVCGTGAARAAAQSVRRTCAGGSSQRKKFPHGESVSGSRRRGPGRARACLSG